MMRLMKMHGVDGYLTFTSDEHLNEYIGEGDERVKFLTGFSGSNGIAITCTHPALYTDSRYYIQAMNQSKKYKLKKMEEEEGIDEYLEKVCKCKQVGICKKFIRSRKYEDLKNKLESRGITLKPFENDLVDIIWKDRPLRAFNKVYSIEEEKFRRYQMELIELCEDSEYREALRNKLSGDDTSVVGRAFKDKLKEIRSILEPDQTLVITELDTIAWIFNLRGSDILYNPVFYSYAIVSKDSAKLFTNEKNIKMDDVDIYPYDDFVRHATGLKGRIVISGECNAYVKDLFEGIEYCDKIRLLQSQKAEVEIEGFHLSYIFDGMALVELFEWVDLSLDKGISEKVIKERLDGIKKRFSGYVQPSFESIVGGGPNGAIVHHKASDRVVSRNEVILIDSGSQYMFGTTDTTRTLHFGEPTPEEKKSYTRVLKGQLRSMRMRFKSSMQPSVLDSLSRIDLWNEMEDYGHATGHGVGHFLCVHESPPTISYSSDQLLKPRQVFSIEPGFYKEGEYGIRIENLVYLKDIDGKFYEITNLTLVPYHLRLIDTSMMSEEEVSHLNRINEEIRSTLEPFMKGKIGYRYLMENTVPIKK
ncbi:X-prolyl aminopeptidase 2 [Encephalitozoon romaleae SJ-2008]|uniref:X-prolyl aminopeptidase 2 n=1 Tax=Encephalitozoon romaleae (strain SJ-2008) TaxID=1178016 RepID=I6ZT68_ENCRO|nr:X-prolyl aminopeptidase 2 [Encephalitozoon romaleae SJ-2008]AFN82821.1 X-prolyl aminopeptidase 2 [Encephalitozoon romaleae SJ-2008]